MSQSKSKEKKDIAIIGMSCRLPGAETLDEFWTIVSKGLSQLQDIPAERLKQFDSEFLHTKRGSFLEHPYLFDNDYFNISLAKIKTMDSKQKNYG